MKRSLLTTLVVVIATTIGFFACTKEVASKAQYLFKPAPNETTVAKIQGKEVSYDEMVNGIESELYEAEMKVFELKMARIKSLVLKKFMEADPQYKGNNDEFLEKYIAKDIKVSDKEVMEFATQRSIPKERLDANFKEKIKDFLKKGKMQEEIEAWVAKKTQKSPVEIYLKEPQRPVKDVEVGNAPFVGKADAKVTIVEFSDFQCPFCAKGAKLMDDLKKKYGSKLKIVFKNFPLPFHKQAKLASQAALCANELKDGSFWKMHDLMFADQTGLTKEGLVEKANKVGVDGKKVSECLDAKKFEAAVDADIKQGESVGVKSTPTFFVNGMLINGAQPIEVFSELIDQELAK